MKDSLEAEVGHPESVVVRIDDADRDVAAGAALVQNFFPRDALQRALTGIHPTTPA